MPFDICLIIFRNSVNIALLALALQSILFKNKRNQKKVATTSGKEQEFELDSGQNQ